MANHAYLQEHFPVTAGTARQYREPAEGTTVSPDEVHSSVEDELDLDEGDTDEDFAEPTEAQKREVFKIHRGLGHPSPNDLGRDLRHAGARRNIVR